MQCRSLSSDRITPSKKQLLATEFSVYSKLTYVNHHKPWNQNTNSVCSLALSYVQNVPFSSWRKHKDGCAIASLLYQWYVDQQNPILSEYMSSKLINVLDLTFIQVCNHLHWNFLRIPCTTNYHYYYHFAYMWITLARFIRQSRYIYRCVRQR